MPNPPPLVLVDGSSYLYRAFHVMQSLTTSGGRSTGAVYGVLNMLRAMQGAYPDSPLVVVFDAPGKTFRDALYAEYKANRPSMPDDLRAQIAPLHQCVAALGFPLIVQPGVEADDVMGTLAVQAAAQGRPVIISTGDKDMAQLVDDQITLVNTMSEAHYDRAGVIAKFGVSPELMVDYLALVGDSSDNIPGVPGIGPKSAVPMLTDIGNLDTIYANLDKVAAMAFRGAKSMPQKLTEFREQAYLSRQLATIKTDVPLQQTVDELANRPADKEKLREIYRDLEFNRWLKELDAGDNSTTPAADTKSAEQTNYPCILDKTAFADWLQRLTAAPLFAFNIETNSGDAMQAEIVGLSFATEPGQAAYVPLAHDYLDAPTQLDRAQVLAALKPILQDSNKAIVAQNLKFDRSVLAQYAIQIQAQPFDTMLESYVLNSVAGRHDLPALARRVLNRDLATFTDIAGKGAAQLRFNQIALEQAAPYAAAKAEAALCLHQALWPQLEAESALRTLYADIEAPLTAVLARIQRNGILIDGPAMAAQSVELAAAAQQLQAQVHALADQPFNLDSPKQLQEVLYAKLNLPVLKKTPKGQPSTAEEVLQQLAENHEIPRLILEYRSLAKLKSTYTDKLPGMVHPATGRIHTTYHQAVAVTGRLSSADPNLQNIPVRSEQGRRIRRAFIAAPGMQMVAADYSQIELRIMAHLSQDAGLLRAFSEGRDVHSATAAEVFRVPIEQVTAEQRRQAKGINFGLIYGMSAFGLGRQLQIDRPRAQYYMDRYFEHYPGVQAFMQRLRTQAAEAGYVETLFGRRLYLPQIKGRGPQRQAAERAAINAPMQGTAADIIKRAMIDVDRWMQGLDYPAHMLMQVHDELVFEVAEAHVDSFIAALPPLMQNAAQLDVPLLVDIGTGANWEEAH